jgi:isopenicillin N synthase-like dioxygenase
LFSLVLITLIKLFVPYNVAVSLTMAPPTASIVCISYQDLVDFDPETVENHELIEKIGKAFGADPSCLGILAVTGIPNFTQQRETLLPLAAQVANLPDLTTCESPESLYSTGWSHGREQLSPGQPDTAKGSYYANPLTEDLVPALMARENASDTNQNQNNEHRAAYWKEQAELHPAFYAANIWPASLPVLRTAVCDMGRTVHTVGCLLATVCDAYCRAHHVPTALHQILSESLNAKARLLHYFHNEKAADFAASESDQDEKQEDGGDDEKLWCSWHNDHGMYSMDKIHFLWHCIH